MCSALAYGTLASNTMGLAGIPPRPVGLADKGYLYSDRPAYRPGQTVHLRGCFRRAIDDDYAIETGKTSTLEVSDNRNRQLRQDRGPAGALRWAPSPAGFSRCPPTSSTRSILGAGHTTRPARATKARSCVEEYRLEPVRLAVDVPRKVYSAAKRSRARSGRRITTARRWPAARFAINWPTNRRTRPRPTLRARSAFKLPTVRVAESQILPLMVALPERNIRDRSQLLPRGPGLHAGREHRPPGIRHRRDLRVAVSSPPTLKAGLPVRGRAQGPAADGRARQGRRTLVCRNSRSETAPADGIARQTLKLDKGGQLRAASRRN